MSTESPARDDPRPTDRAVLLALSSFVSECAMRGQHLPLAKAAGIPPLDFAAAAKALAEIAPDPDGDPFDTTPPPEGQLDMLLRRWSRRDVPPEIPASYVRRELASNLTARVR